MRHMGLGSWRVVRVLDGGHVDSIVFEDRYGCIRGGHIMSVELCIRIHDAALVDGADFNVAVNDRYASRDQSGRSVGPIGVRRRGLAVGPLV